MTCAEGDRIDWHAHEIKWCEEHKENCPPRPPVIPVDEFRLEKWSQKFLKPMQCEVPPGGMPKFTVAILAYKETESLSASLDTYKAAKFLEVRLVVVVLLLMLTVFMVFVFGACHRTLTRRFCT